MELRLKENIICAFFLVPSAAFIIYVYIMYEQKKHHVCIKKTVYLVNSLEMVNTRYHPYIYIWMFLLLFTMDLEPTTLIKPMGRHGSLSTAAGNLCGYYFVCLWIIS